MSRDEKKFKNSRKFEKTRFESGECEIWKPREARVALSLMMLTSSTNANSLNIVSNSSSVMCFGTWPTKSFTLSSLDLLSSFVSAINVVTRTFVSFLLNNDFLSLSSEIQFRFLRVVDGKIERVLSLSSFFLSLSLNYGKFGSSICLHNVINWTFFNYWNLMFATFISGYLRLCHCLSSGLDTVLDA